MAPDFDSLVAEIAALWPWEAVAVALAVAYLALAIRESAWCWPAGLASSAIYLVLFFRARLYMESVLQLFYIGIAVYGWRRWLGDAPDARRARHEAPTGIVTWSARGHALALATIAALAGVNGLLLATYTPAAFPYFDALVAWGSVITTWMVARKVLENWLYWFVIDALSAWLYVRRGLWLTAGLFVVYLAMIVVGWRAWRERLAAAVRSPAGAS